MARRLQTREYVLVVVLAGALGLAWYTLGGGRQSGSGEAEGGKAGSLGQAPEVRVAELAGKTVDYDPQGRNLFAYYTPPPPKPRPAPVRPPVQVKRPPKPQSTAPVERPKATPQKPRPPQVPYSYIGLLGPKESKIGVFMHGEEMTLAGIGEALDKQFLVVEFGYQRVVIGYTDKRWKDETTELKQRKAAR